ncbi:hypothetical protein OC834_007563 [Tilletia horrida]|nr:hypothetical protein OC834_007563 [Tilletia horrida]KAK0548853.1 hypothetical protein OC844_006964 [Tilletia horrida]
MAPPTLTDLHLAAGAILRAPTYLSMSGDVLVTTAGDSTEDGMEVLFMLADSRLVQAELSTDYGNDLPSGVHNFSNAMLGTHPMHLFLPGDGNWRMVPEEVDGCDPLLSALPWRGPVLNGIAVVAEVNNQIGTLTLTGRSYLGEFVGWIPFRIDGRVEDGLCGPFPIPHIPVRGSLVSFDGIMDGAPSNGAVQAVIYRIQHLQHAHSSLLAELGVVRTVREQKRARHEAAQAFRDEQTAKQLLVDGAPSSQDGSGKGGEGGDDVDPCPCSLCNRDAASKRARISR